MIMREMSNYEEVIMREESFWKVIMSEMSHYEETDYEENESL